MKRVVIVGAGHAGVQVADSLRAMGYADGIVLLSDEAELPYQRPPLSKSFMLGEDPDALLLRGKSFFTENAITLRLDCPVTAIDPNGRRVELRSGERLAYDELVLATGSSNRKYSLGTPPAGIVQDLRTAKDARALREKLAKIRRLVVVGAGFVGLEIAAAACKAHIEVSVLELTDRVMGRVLSPAMSRLFEAMHRQAGVTFHFREGASGIEAAGQGWRVRTSAGRTITTDAVLWSVGATPNSRLASAAGLASERGVLVDASLQTSSPHVWAIGDCARYPSRYAGGLVRLESVQNAVDQAQHLARVLLNGPAPYGDVPWFWTIQGKYKLTIAGIFKPGDATAWHEYGPGKGSVFCFRNDRLSAVESLNRPGDHIAARALLGMENHLGYAEVMRDGFELKKFRKALAAEAAP